MPQRTRITLSFLIMALLLAACDATSAEQNTPVPLPTIYPTPTPEYNNEANAEIVVRTFLDAWQAGDFVTMYDLLTFPSRQATDFDTFTALYANAYEEMRFAGLEHHIRAQARETDRVIVFIYDVDFTSHLVGTFSDTNREMRLVLEDTVQDWRVAWTPADLFAEMGNGGQLRLQTFAPRRANIYDTDGEILADMNGVMVAVNIIRGEVPDVEACTFTLARVLGTTTEVMRDRLINYGLDQRAQVGLIEPDIYRENSEALEENCAVQFDSIPTRRYLQGSLAPHIIGNVGFPDEADIPIIEAAGFQRDTILGRSGIERSWDETLRGTPGGRLSLVSPDGDLLRILATGETEPAQSVYLTLDADLQRFAQRALEEAYEENAWGSISEGASVIALEVQTGAVRAMVSWPTYNGNAFTTYPPMGSEDAQIIIQAAEQDPRRPLLNRPTQGAYPTGSVMKAVTAVAALDSGVYTVDERYMSVGTWNRDIVRTDWNLSGHGYVNLSEALTHSCNTCFYEAGYRMDQTDPWLFSQYAEMLGLGIPTGIRDIPDESGLIGNPENKPDYESNVPWNFSDAVNIAIGQGGVQVTPLQLLQVYTMIANDGTRYRPQLVERAGLLDDISYTMRPEVVAEERFSLEALESIREGLCAVTTLPYGTATHIFRTSPLQDLGVCGKTGTATSPGDGLPPHAWFVAWAPRDNPEIAVVVMVEHSGEGSSVAAPIARRILEYYFFGRDFPLYG